MTLRCIVLGTFIMFIIMSLPVEWSMDAPCTQKSCFHKSCDHFKKFKDVPGFSTYRELTENTVLFLKNIGGGSAKGYVTANIFAYAIIFPAMAMFNGWLNREKRMWQIASILSVVVLLIVGSAHSSWFNYCTEFCIRISNLTGLTYGGVCFLLFVVAIPGVLILDFTRGCLKRFYKGRKQITSL